MENPFLTILERLTNIESKVDAAISTTKNADGLSKDDFLLIDAAAEYLGVKKSTLYSYTRQKKIRHYKVSTNVYFKRSDLNDYIGSGLIDSSRRRSA